MGAINFVKLVGQEINLAFSLHLIATERGELGLKASNGAVNFPQSAWIDRAESIEVSASDGSFTKPVKFMLSMDFN